MNKKDSALLDVEVSGGNYLFFERTTETSANAYIKVPKVLSADYYVAVVVVPKNITDEYVTPESMNPSKLQFTIKQAPGKGSTKKIYEQTFVTNAVGMDTIYLTKDGKRDGERAVVTPTYAEYYDSKSGPNVAKDYNVTFEIKSVGAGRNDKNVKYDFSIRIDKILFIPVPYSE